VCIKNRVTDVEPPVSNATDLIKCIQSREIIMNVKNTIRPISAAVCATVFTLGVAQTAIAMEPANTLMYDRDQYSGPVLVDPADTQVNVRILLPKRSSNNTSELKACQDATFNYAVSLKSMDGALTAGTLVSIKPGDPGVGVSFDFTPGSHEVIINGAQSGKYIDKATPNLFIIRPIGPANPNLVGKCSTPQVAGKTALRSLSMPGIPGTRWIDVLAWIEIGSLQ